MCWIGRISRQFIMAICLAVIPIGVAQAADSLPSWHDGPSKAAIIIMPTPDMRD